MNENSTQRKAILKVNNITLEFGGVKALNDLNINVRNKEILGIIGPNGAGKTCVLNCINGFYRPKSGSINFQGIDITYLSSYKRAKLGVIEHKNPCPLGIGKGKRLYHLNELLVLHNTELNPKYERKEQTMSRSRKLSHTIWY